MSRKSIGAIVLIIAIVAISVISVSALTYFQSKPNSGSNPIVSSSASPSVSISYSPTIQPIDQDQIQTYTGYLVSYNYVTSQTIGVASTQLVFTNKTFDYQGYISVEENCVYNVTYYVSEPNQALNITRIDLTPTPTPTGFMQTEQVKVDNPTFDTSSSQIVTIDVTNTGTQAVVLNRVSINGIDVTAQSDLAAPYTLRANAILTITVTQPTGIMFIAGNNYQFTVTSSQGNRFSYSAVAPS